LGTETRVPFGLPLAKKEALVAGNLALLKRLSRPDGTTPLRNVNADAARPGKAEFR
jgi:hypothetical protein